jgi:hypothetical protein
MSQLQPIQYAFDVSAIDPYVGGGAPLAAGQYLSQITNMQVRENNDKSTGHNLALEYTVVEGEFKGRKFFENLNLWHSGSSAAVEIANKQLSSIGHAVGILTGSDPTVLAFKTMLVELELTEAQADKINTTTGETVKGRGPQNRIIRRDPPNVAGSAPVPGAAAAGNAPAFNPAAQSQAPAQSAPTGGQQQAAPIQQQMQQGAPAQQGAGAPPPWQK